MVPYTNMDERPRSTTDSPQVLSDDAHVCPDGSTLGAIETCINYTSIEGGPSAYGACFAGNIKFPCGCVDGFTPYTTKFYLWSDYVHFRCCSGRRTQTLSSSSADMRFLQEHARTKPSAQPAKYKIQNGCIVLN